MYIFGTQFQIMAQVEVLMPKMGESVMEATITNWVKNEGDKILMDEIIVEIATDKVDSEVPSTVAGILVKKLYNSGDVVKIGQPFCIVETDVNASVSSGPATTPAPSESVPQPAQVEAQIMAEISNHSSREAEVETGLGDRFYSPLVKNIARQEGIGNAELDRIPGSGKDGRVTKEDILRYIQTRGTQSASAPQATAQSQPVVQPQPATAQQTTAVQTATPAPKPAVINKPAVSINAGDEIIQMDRMRKLIADHMVMSKHTSPHVTSFVEVDVTNLVLWRDKVKDDFLRKTGEKITYTPIIIEAIVKAIKDFPNINASVDGDNIIIRKNINIGMATALPSGNLIVPVIRNADTMNLVGLTKSVNDLAARARAGKLNPDDIQGGTYTVSNVGTFGNVMGTPIINQPQVAIMAVGAIKKKPAVVETEYGDVIAIRQFMYLSHSYDHRVVDGALGGSFVRKVADYLEAFDPNRTY
jgi:2-oxoglutarate dehydrogenase E2 component (dihydrolipoamide succinyltransferase)